jgi:hypothetical protein
MRRRGSRAGHVRRGGWNALHGYPRDGARLVLSRPRSRGKLGDSPPPELVRARVPEPRGRRGHARVACPDEAGVTGQAAGAGPRHPRRDHGDCRAGAGAHPGRADSLAWVAESTRETRRRVARDSGRASDTPQAGGPRELAELRRGRARPVYQRISRA